MAKIVKRTFGRLTEILDPTKSKYKKYLNIPGEIIICESIHRFPGKRIIHLLMNAGFFINNFHTSCGEVREVGNKLIFEDRYVFTVDESC